MKNRLCWTVLLMLAAIICKATTAGYAQSAASGDSALARRIQQAKEINAGAADYVTAAKQFHKTAQQLIEESQRLKKEAQSILLAQALDHLPAQNSGNLLEGSAKFSAGAATKAPPLRLSAAEYKSALNQYAGDVGQFVNHAEAYVAHLNKFNTEIGACHATEQAYAANLKKYELHIADFHIPNMVLPGATVAGVPIEPPHICVRMTFTEGEASHITNGYINDQLNVIRAQQDLQNTEAKLFNEQARGQLVNQKLENEIKRAQGERDLAMEFGKLREEYDLIKTEKDRIASINKAGGHADGKKVVLTKVQGKLQSHSSQ